MCKNYQNSEKHTRQVSFLLLKQWKINDFKAPVYFTIHNCIPGGINMKYGGGTKSPPLGEESLYQLPTTSPTWPELG